ncbi:class I SAM-dependent methyltransferase [Kibdelosporangium aridum]|nr:class I SAM-dependent methyltransferase [Kibdelosporangium aridum]
MRKVVRDKVVRALEEVTGCHAAEQAAHIAELRREVADLNGRRSRDLHEQAGHIAATVKEAVRSGRPDMSQAGELEATLQSAALILEHMREAQALHSARQTLEHALTLASRDGMALEFGVYTGSTLEVIAHARDKKSVYGFDSFQGLPETWRPGFLAGTFAMDGLPDVPGAELVVGTFDATLPGFLAEHAGPVDFLHVDCDLYASTKTVLDHVGPHLHPGSIVVFDEYVNYPGWQEHEHRAWSEYIERTGLRFEYAGYTVDHEQVIVRVLGTSGS